MTTVTFIPRARKESRKVNDKRIGLAVVLNETAESIEGIVGDPIIVSITEMSRVYDALKEAWLWANVAITATEEWKKRNKAIYTDGPDCGPNCECGNG